MARRRCGVAFDIDGVLLRGKQALPSARQALQLVHTHGIPHVFLTNGGGMLERHKAESLGAALDLHIDPRLMILAHSPLRELVPKYHDQLVLVCGNETVCDVARDYGFTRVVNVAQVVRARPSLWPFSKTLYHRTDYPEGFTLHPEEVDLKDIAAVLVMYDGLCWGAELQVMLDVLREGPSTPVYFTNADMTFAGAHAAPRLAAGAFRVALEAIHAQLHGSALQYTQYGKPTAATYAYAERVLGAHTYYMVGDNPAADVRGANARHSWTSVLVRTGVFSGDSNDAQDPADVVVDDVLGAVQAIIKREHLY